jgi:hypothetical protein
MFQSTWNRHRWFGIGRPVSKVDYKYCFNVKAVSNGTSCLSLLAQVKNLASSLFLVFCLSSPMSVWQDFFGAWSGWATAVRQANKSTISLTVLTNWMLGHRLSVWAFSQERFGDGLGAGR